MDRYRWVDQLLATVRAERVERSEEERLSMERWIGEQVDQLRRGDIK